MASTTAHHLATYCDHVQRALRRATEAEDPPQPHGPLRCAGEAAGHLQSALYNSPRLSARAREELDSALSWLGRIALEHPPAHFRNVGTVRRIRQVTDA